jgi:multiple sugar transport system permease protein
MAGLGLAVPTLKSVAQTPGLLTGNELPPQNGKLFLDTLEQGILGQSPPLREWEQIFEDEVRNCIRLNRQTPAQAAENFAKRWNAVLASPLKAEGYPRVPWGRVGMIGAGAVVLGAALFWWNARREKLGPLDRAAQRSGWLFVSPWLIGFLALTLGPMVVSALLSFTRWTAMTPLGRAEFLGIANYRQLFTNDPTFGQSLWVTGWYALLVVPIGQAAALAVALLMNARVRGITIFRTAYFVPSVVSGVALSTLWFMMFHKDYGPVNAVLRPIANVFGTTPPDWFGYDDRRWAVPAFVIMSLWGVGSGMVIYLAGLKGVPASLYEAARIDGAGPVRRFWNVTLPMLSPLIFFNLVMGIIASFQVFTQAHVITDGRPTDATRFYVLNLFIQAFDFHNMGYASAMAWVLFVLVLMLTLLVFRGSRGLVYYEGLKA